MTFKGSSPNIHHGAKDTQLNQGRTQPNNPIIPLRNSPTTYGMPQTPLVPYLPGSMPEDHHGGAAPRAQIHSALTDDAGSEVEDASMRKDYLVEVWHRTHQEAGTNSFYESGASACTLGDGRLTLKRGGPTLLSFSPVRPRVQDIPHDRSIRQSIIQTVSHQQQLDYQQGEAPQITPAAASRVAQPPTTAFDGHDALCHWNACVGRRIDELDTKVTNEIHARHVASLFAEEESDIRDCKIATLERKCASIDFMIQEMAKEKHEKQRLEASMYDIQNLVTNLGETVVMYRQEAQTNLNEIKDAYTSLVSEVSLVVRNLGAQIAEIKANYEAIAAKVLAGVPVEPAMSSGSIDSSKRPDSN